MSNKMIKITSREGRARIISLICCFLVVLITFLYYRNTSLFAKPNNLDQDGILHNPSGFTFPLLPQSWYEENCLHTSKTLGLSIIDINQKLKLMHNSDLKECQVIFETFELMFRIEEFDAPVVLSKTFSKQVKGWLNNNPTLFEQVTHQKVYKIVNKFTFEESVYNPLRSKRPISKNLVNPLEYIENLTLSTSKTCDFCSYKEHTAEDTFGRIENEFSATASNTFKLAEFHGLFFPKSHHPLQISYEVLSELIVNTSQQWFQAAYQSDPKQIYPSLLWDTLPHAGASQVHPHLHGLLSSHQYAGLIESMRHVAESYYVLYKRSYWTDFLLVHWSLGLAIRKSEAVIIVPLNARKDHEYMIMSLSVNRDVVKLLFQIVEGYKKNLKVYCWSGGGAYPVMNKQVSGLPVIFRIGSRGMCTSLSSDVSSLELYTVNNINTDLDNTFNSIDQTDLESL